MIRFQAILSWLYYTFAMPKIKIIPDSSPDMEQWHTLLLDNNGKPCIRYGFMYLEVRRDFVGRTYSGSRFLANKKARRMLDEIYGVDDERI